MSARRASRGAGRVLDWGMSHPQLLHTVLDTTRPRRAAEFYRERLGLVYRPGDATPADDDADDDADWLVLTADDGQPRLAFQQVERLTPTTWPAPVVPMQLHLDFTVNSTEELDRHLSRALDLGGRLVLDRRADTDEPLVVVADPDGHPFCLFVA